MDIWVSNQTEKNKTKRKTLSLFYISIYIYIYLVNVIHNFRHIQILNTLTIWFKLVCNVLTAVVS